MGLNLDIHTLTLINLMFFGLYAVVMLVSAALHRGVKGGTWFAFSNLLRGGSLILILFYTKLPALVGSVLASGLLVLGYAMLHRSFTELLDKGRMWWRLQMGLVVVAVLGVALLNYVVPTYAGILMLVSMLLGAQSALVSCVIFRYTQPGAREAGWFTAGMLMFYAVIHVVRAAEAYLHGTPGGPMAGSVMVTVWLLGSLVANGGVAFGFMFMAASQLRMEVLHEAHTDSLTGVMNRRAIDGIAARELSRCRRLKEPISLVTLDLDGLKKANDTHGHSCGDAVLRAVAECLMKSVRSPDVVARLGGDEFLVLLPSTSEAVAAEVAERLRSALEKLRVNFDGEVLEAQCSMGVAAYPDGNGTWEELLRRSDDALYTAKRGGRNRVGLIGAEEAVSV